MANPGKLKVTLLDVHETAIREEADIELRNVFRGTLSRVTTKSGKVTIADLVTPPEGVYSVSVTSHSYKAAKKFVTIKSTGTTELDFTLPVKPERVKQMNAPAYVDLPQDAKTLLETSDGVLGFENLAGKALYDALDDIRRAGLLNIIAKTRLTQLPVGGNVLSSITKLTELRGDRFFAVVPHALREETENSVAANVFDKAGDLLHHPPEGFERAGSYKTRDPFGNLQLTFFVKGTEWRADIDIDDAAGFGHVEQVVGHKLTGKKTHPYDIHQILLHRQQLDPGYALIV